MPDLVLSPPWPEFLTDVDQSLSEAVELHCLGGFVLAAMYDIPRTTNDLDYISADPGNAYEERSRIAGPESDLAKKHKVFLHLVGVADYPENYESRLTTLSLGLKKLTLRFLEPYDLLLSKLTRNNPRDMQDVQALAKKLGLRFDLLVERFQTEMSWVPNRARHRLTLDAAWKDYFDPAV
ncbi:MAG: DUF6036 family nucleotidyltransferase [Terriglobales bacterium]|jgi:hypothetical protein